MTSRERVLPPLKLGILTDLSLTPLAALAQHSVPILDTLQPPAGIAEPQKNSGAQIGRDASGRPVLTLDEVPSNIMGGRPRRASLEDDVQPYHKAGLEFLTLRINAGSTPPRSLTCATSTTCRRSGPAKGSITPRSVPDSYLHTGKLLVEVLDADGPTIPDFEQSACLPLTGGAVRQAVKWGTESSLPKGKPLRLRFHLTNGDLFSYSFETRR